MKTRSLLATGVAILLLAGCGQGNSSNSSASAPAPGTPANPRIVEITANDTMKYSLTTIDAKPGEELTVALTNTGSFPKEVMGHDWILLKAGSDPAAFSGAASTAKDTDYVPPSLKGEIIAQIGLLGPRKSDEVTFTVPATPGEYPYLCSFPAHYQAGMHGVLVVK
jgi:azurin